MGINVYQPLVEKDFWLELQRSAVGGYSELTKFGRNPSVGTSFETITKGAVYQTPQVGAATALRVKAGDANDTAAGSGAQEITLIGLDETGAEVTETLATAGASASAATSATFMRLYRAYTSASGTYATTATGSHTADVVIENSAGGTDWLTIDSTSYARGQSEVGAYTVPLGKTAYVVAVYVNVDSNKTADIIMFKRENILQTSAPYKCMRIQLQLGGVAGEGAISPKSYHGPYPQSTDIIFMAKAATSAEVDVNFKIILVNN